MSALVGDFLASALLDFGVKTGPLWVAIALISLAVATVFAYRDVKLAGRLMLILELVSLLAILVLCLVILGRARALPAAAMRPSPQSGGWSGMAYALVFVVLSFAGFEGAATLGEETTRPRRDIPAAMLGSLLLAGLFFTFASYCEVQGYGLAGVRDLAKATAPLNDLANRYLDRRFAAALDVAAAFSSFSGALGSLTASGRLFFALGRAGLSAPLARTHPVHGAPGAAVLISGALAGLLLLIWAPSTGASGFYANVSTVAVLAVILVYLGVIAAECRLDAGAGRWPWPAFTLTGAGILIWCLLNTVLPVPAWPDWLWPYLVAAWVLVGVLLLLARPGLARTAALEPAGVEAAVKAGVMSSEA
jgi:amino acid transporter